MQLILKDENDKHFNTYHGNYIINYQKFLPQLLNFNQKLNATLIVYDENLSCNELKELKMILKVANITLSNIYTNSREISLIAKYLKMKVVFDFNNSKKINQNLLNQKNFNQEDLTHKGTIRSGDRISSNGDLFIIGDVNPGAKISAKKNIYVWGKLNGVAFAGENGFDNVSIAALYLNPLQLSINKTIAIGPKEKPINYYPEIAFLEKGQIVIQPLIINK